MTNKLMYRLGLEELAEVAPIAEVPSVSETELQLDQMGNELHGDVKLLDVLSADTETLEDVKSSLEQALKGTMSRGALSFAKRAVDMVDRRWGGDYPAIGMEADEDSVVASMEDGVGQRLKDMGKALMEMLKKIWAKLKEWGGKLLQLLGFRKKELKEIEERADDLKDLTKFHASEISRMEHEAAVSEPETSHEIGTHDTVISDTPAVHTPSIDNEEISRLKAEASAMEEKHHAHAEEMKQRYKQGKDAYVAKQAAIKKFSPVIDKHLFSYLLDKDVKMPVGVVGFKSDLKTLLIFSEVAGIINEVAAEINDYLRGLSQFGSDEQKRLRTIISEIYAAEFNSTQIFPGYLSHGYTGGGGVKAFIDNRDVQSRNPYITSIHVGRGGSADFPYMRAAAELDYSVINLYPGDVKTLGKELEHAIDVMTESLIKQQDVFERQSKEMADICNRLIRSPSDELHRRVLINATQRYSTAFVDTQSQFKSYLKIYTKALTRHLELSTEYWEYVDKLEKATKH